MGDVSSAQVARAVKHYGHEDLKETLHCIRLVDAAERASKAKLELEACVEPTSTSMKFDVDKLNKWTSPVQTIVDGNAALHLGWGNEFPQQMALRKRLGKPGAPWGGLGFFDPQVNANDANIPESCRPPVGLTAQMVRAIKLEQLRNCAAGLPSMYFFALQPKYDTNDHVTSAEVLVRIQNGQDSAPFEDIVAFMDPSADLEVQETYAMWKVAEIMDFCPGALMRFPVLKQSLSYIAANLRPSDMSTDSLIYRGVQKRLAELPEEARRLVTSKVAIEVTEDQEYPKDFAASLEAWRVLGFQLHYDDDVGGKARDALGQTSKVFHTPDALMPFLDYFTHIKIDIEWAGYCIFLSHPSYCAPNRASMKAEVLQHAMDDDKVFVPRGQNLVDTGASYSKLLDEFATFCKNMFASDRDLTIELTVRENDPSNAFAVEKLKELGVDIFGEHKSRFQIQGGLTGAKTFTPEVLADAAESAYALF